MFINQYAINVRSRLINIHIELTIISQAQKRKEKAQQRLQNSAAKSRKLTELFAASIISNNNLIETGQSVMLY